MFKIIIIIIIIITKVLKKDNCLFYDFMILWFYDNNMILVVTKQYNCLFYNYKIILNEIIYLEILPFHF